MMRTLWLWGLAGVFVWGALTGVAAAWGAMIWTGHAQEAALRLREIAAKERLAAAQEQEIVELRNAAAAIKPYMLPN